MFSIVINSILPFDSILNEIFFKKKTCLTTHSQQCSLLKIDVYFESITAVLLYLGICSSCKSYMYKLASNNPIPINVIENWKQGDLMLFKSGRDCSIQSTICTMTKSMDRKVLGKTKARIEKSKSEKPLLLCHNCFCNLVKSIPHKCSTGQEKVNVSSQLSSKSSKVQQQVTSILLKNIYASSQTNLGEEINISTG